MDFSIYVGSAEVRILVPHLFHIPEAVRPHFPLSLVGHITASLDELNHEVVEQLGLRGFAVLPNADFETLRARCAPSPA